MFTEGLAMWWARGNVSMLARGARIPQIQPLHFPRRSGFHPVRQSGPRSPCLDGRLEGILFQTQSRFDITLVFELLNRFQQVIFELKFAEAARLRDAQSVRSRLALRERLECKNFQWYLKEVWPENFFPAPDRFFGKVKCAFIICHVPDVLEQVTGTDSGTCGTGDAQRDQTVPGTATRRRRFADGG